jgi:hypothetical protein
MVKTVLTALGNGLRRVTTKKYAAVIQKSRSAAIKAAPRDDQSAHGSDDLGAK